LIVNVTLSFDEVSVAGGKACPGEPTSRWCLLLPALRAHAAQARARQGRGHWDVWVCRGSLQAL